MKKLCERFYNETARIENLILLAGVVADDSLPDPIRDFLDDEDFETIEECFGTLPDYVKADLAEGDKGVMSEWLLHEGKLGFLMQVATPIMTKTSKSSASFSWGYYTTKWVYGDTLNAALKAGFAFVKGQRKKEVEKFKASSSGRGHRPDGAVLNQP